MTYARRCSTRAAVFAVLILVIAGAGLARATAPKRGGHYRGTGQQAFNNTPDGSFANQGFRPRALISFRVSPNGKRILNFRGSYFYYCGSGTATVTAKFLIVRSDGSFHYAFSTPSRGPGGVTNGTSSVDIRGRFTGSGRAARVTYREEARFSSQPASQRPCATQVSGIVTAR